MIRQNQESNSDIMELQEEQHLSNTELNRSINTLPNNSRESRYMYTYNIFLMRYLIIYISNT